MLYAAAWLVPPPSLLLPLPVSLLYTHSLPPSGQVGEFAALLEPDQHAGVMAALLSSRVATLPEHVQARPPPPHPPAQERPCGAEVCPWCSPARCVGRVHF